MVGSSDLSGKLAFDANGLNNLKLAAKENSPEAIKGVAKQFEAIFMNMMLKSMRDASASEDNLFDNEQSRTFTSMLDQQVSSNLSAKGLGLSDILAKQLSKNGYLPQNSTAPEQTEGKTPAVTPNTEQPAPSLNPVFKAKPMSGHAADFQNHMSKHAEAASRATGVPAHLMMGQAALESGWGKHQITAADGTPSHNLFGIKASSDWHGKVVEASTTEYIHGIKQNRIEKFRAYDSYADSFKDFANMIRSNPRYEKVMANLHNINNYALSMQKAGYASDPNYAAKLASVIQKISAT